LTVQADSGRHESTLEFRNQYKPSATVNIEIAQLRWEKAL